MAQNFLLAILLASLFLNLVIFLSRLTGQALQVKAKLSSEIARPPGARFIQTVELVIQAELWEVVLPAFVYSLVYSFLPFSGVRAGLFFGLIIFILGSLPEAISLANAVRLPLLLWLHQLVWRLVKLFLIFGTFGYFFS